MIGRRIVSSARIVSICAATELAVTPGRLRASSSRVAGLQRLTMPFFVRSARLSLGAMLARAFPAFSRNANGCAP